MTAERTVPTVALVTPYYPPKIGGVERYVAELARGLAADGGNDCDNDGGGGNDDGGGGGRDGGDGAFRPVVITTAAKGRRTTRSVQDGVTVIRLGVWLRISNTPLSPLWPIQVRRWLRRTGADVVNAHAPVPGLGDVAVLCAGKRPVVFTYHAGTMHKGVPGSGLADRIIAGYERRVLPRVFARCDVPVPVGPSSLAARQEGAELIPPGVDVLCFTPGDEGARERELVYVGRMDRTSAWKGVDVLVTAFAALAEQLPELRLRLVGAGDALEDHLDLAERLGVRERVLATGALAGAELVRAVQRAAVLVLPSTTDAECAGTVLMEAMACATPVVASDVGSLAYVVGRASAGEGRGAAAGAGDHDGDAVTEGTRDGDGVAGLIVEPGSPEALAAAIARILTEDGLAAKLGAAGRERAEQNFAKPLLVQRYRALFARLGTPADGRAVGRPGQ
ncbi:MAG TPA: glycosyltransferase family 4 protein [Actinospica sp.]|nr:glycosyltransferase family 4 protein [Actinospica sp.]